MQNKKKIYYNYLEEKIIPILIPLENERKKTVRNVFISSGIMFILGIVFAYLFIYISMQSDLTLLILPFFLFLMYLFFIKSIVNIILKNREYQAKLVKNVLPLFFEPIAKFKKWPKNNNTETIINSQLFPNFDTQEDVSCIFGIYKNTNIIISDTRLTLPVKGGTKPNLFKGTTIQLELPKTINNHIILISKNKKVVNNLNQINPHIQELNKYLYTFAKNTKNIDIINKDFWNIIKRFGETYIAKSFGFSYNQNTVYIALKQKNPMQFGFILNSLLDKKSYNNLIERFAIIYELIDFINEQNN